MSIDLTLTINHGERGAILALSQFQFVPSTN
jgi:hypothetical protein